MSKKVIILGGLGNGSVISNAIIDANNRGFREYEFAGYLNDRVFTGEEIEGLPVLGNLADTQYFLNRGYFFINTIYRIDGQQERIDLFDSLQIPDSALATFIHPLAYVAPNVEFSPGCVVMPNVSISPGVKLGKCCLVMVNATIGHNNLIGDHCHFAAQSCTSSWVNISKGVHLGLKSCVREGIRIGMNSTLGMGSVLLQNIGENEIWAGNPAQFIREARNLPNG
jgi:sugar O-acyltransferase (sialic acid O-acetyltransferase NeuD family)